MQSPQQIQFAVGAWSRENFGDQETPYLNIYEPGNVQAGEPRSPESFQADHTARHTGLVVGLGSLAPLMGLAEELGELVESADAGSLDGRKDSVADIAIYLCDYLCREDLQWPIRPELEKRDQFAALSGIIIGIGRLQQAHLKRHQRIRGMHDDETFKDAQAAAVRVLVWHLDAYAKRAFLSTNLVEILNEVWAKIVSKRDWKKNATDGKD